MFCYRKCVLAHKFYMAEIFLKIRQTLASQNVPRSSLALASLAQFAAIGYECIEDKDSGYSFYNMQLHTLDNPALLSIHNTYMETHVHSYFSLIPLPSNSMSHLPNPFDLSIINLYSWKNLLHVLNFLILYRLFQ